MKDDDLLIINADHGCDPAFKGTDHTREYIPILMYHKKMTKPINLGVLDTFADLGATLADNFGVEKPKIGTSLKNKLA
jgi:phosphopentomutase